MVNNNVGAVTANIELNTKQFEEAVKKLKGDVKEIKESFNQKTSGNNGLLEEVKNLKKEIDSLREKTNNYRETIKTLREQNADYAEGIRNLNKLLEQSKKEHSNFSKELKNEQSNLENTAKSASKYIKLQERMTKFSWANVKNSFKGMGDLFTLGTGRSKYADFSQWIKSLNTGKTAISSVKREFETLTEVEKRQMDQLKNASRIFNKMDIVLSNTGRSLSQLTTQMEYVSPVTVATEKAFEGATKGAEAYRERISALSKELNKSYAANEKYYASVGAMSTKYWNQIRNSSVSNPKNWKTGEAFQQSNYNVKTMGMSDYYGNINKINQTLSQQVRITREAKLATDGLSQAYRKTNLNTYKANLNQINKTLEQQRLRTAQLEAAQQSIYYKNAPNNLNTYKMNMDKINTSLEKQTGTHRKNNQEIRTGQRSMREFGTSMGKAEQYSNNLYRGLQKVRSVIVSFKTIMAAMGGMAVWNFAFELVDKAKETYAAKNEMESLLNKNSHVNAEGVQYFNKALDETVSKFQRINKYGLGETAANIGLEFDLNAKEMAESLDVISMIQNEYIRAGRTVEEAGLAVKDILQGEFMRLSRETGVGKDDLKDKYGWSGKTDDIKGLMDALEKAGKARHWDLFAEKATSVDDVITITQNRFGEFGADLLTNIEPTIVGAFNGILEAVDKLKTGFSGMGTLGKYLTIVGVGLGAFTGISTALMVFKRDMGLAQIATLGWGRSLGTALLGLNKTDVALHGFWKTLVATTSGTKAATVSNIGFGKSILGRIAGVKHEKQAEYGLASAIMARQVEMTKSLTTEKAAIIESGNLRQKLIYLAKGEVVANKEAATFGKTLKSLITSSKLLKIAILGIGSVAVIGAFATVAQWADSVKQRMELYNETLSDGKEKIKDATDIYTKFQKKLDKTSKDNANYDALSNQTETAEHNVYAAKLSYTLAKQIKKTNKEISEANNLTFQGLINDSLESNGIDTQKWSTDYIQMKQVAYDVKHAEEERYHFLYQSSQHINEQVAAMKEAKVSEDDRVKYITEYSSKAQEAAENLKKFNEGDINAGAYYLMNRAQLMWIDLWNNQHFIKFWESVKKTWEDVKPSLYAMKDTLIGLGESLADFFSTDFGRWVGTIGLLGTGIGVVVGKMSKWITGNNIVLGGLKKLGSSLVERIKEWRGLKKATEEANTKSTGGISPEGKVDNKVPQSRGEWWQDTKGKIYQDSTKYARAAVGIAAGMLLISEAVMMLNVPMWSLAQTGKYFKSVEPQIRDGIEGLKLIAPVMMVLLPPVIALSYVFEKYGVEAGTIAKGAWKAAVGIAAGMLLVAEAVFMMNAPLLAIASVGYVFSWQKDAVLKGKEALQLVTDCLVSLAPTIPLFIGGIALMALVFAAPEVGLPALGAVALGIGASMLLVAEAIVGLNVPLAAIAQTGQNYPNLDSVRQGSEAIKITAEALKYVSDAMGYLTQIDLNLLAQAIEDVVAKWFGVDLGTKLTDLTGEGGVLEQLNDFVKVFNSDKFTIEAPNPDKITALGAAGDGIKTIGDAMSKVKTAMDNLPDEFKNGTAQTGQVGNQLGITGNNTNGTAKTTTNSTNYFDTFKEPIKQLKSFIYDFNNSDEFNIEKIDPTRVENLSSSADLIETVKQAVDKVKTTMQGIGDSGNATAFAEGGWFGQAGYNLFHMTGEGAINNGSSSGNYKSSLGSQLQEMEDVIDDLFTFQSNISSKGTSEGGENANISGATAMITQIQDAISKVSSSLSNAVPQFKGKGNALSSALIEGLKAGLTGVSAIGGSIVNNLANGIMTNKGTVYNTANSLGKTTADKFRTGVDPMNDYMTWEISYVKKALTERKDELGQDAYDLGSHIASRFKEGDDINSPGIMARSMSDEVGYIRDYLSVNDLPQMAYNLANNMSSNFSLDFGLSNIQLPNLSEFTSKLNVIPSTVANVKTQVSTNFTNMKNSVGTSLQGIATNAQGKYAQIVSTTRTSLNNMKSATIKNIGNIKTSWHGMQSALIASAENIKTQTSQKINKLKTNLGEFWNKIKHPDQLIAGGVAGGKPKGSIRRRNRPHIHQSYAGSPTLFKPQRSTQAPDDNIRAYLECLFNSDKPCYAGWNFNWTDKIKDKFNGWNTHFNKYNLDSHLNVGKFNNSNFPVKGQADIFKDYVFDVIRGTTYDFYFNSKYGSPAEALRAGHFNCWDGTQIILALARAFGLGGSEGHGTWNGIGHMFARIPGIGVIDPTAIQQNGTFKSPKVKGYSAGSRPRNYGGNGDVGKKIVHNHGDTVVNINAPVYGVDDLHKAIEDGVNKANRKLFRNSYSGV